MRILGDVIDDDGLPARADLVADGGLDLELAARLEAERDVVADAAGNPAVLGDTRDRGEPHAGHAAHDIQDGGTASMLAMAETSSSKSVYGIRVTFGKITAHHIRACQA